MKTITPKQMQRLEQNLFEKTPLSPSLLMEKAAYEIVNQIKKNYGIDKVLFVCGPGNNGGDGYAAARLYQGEGGEAVVWKVLESKSDLCHQQEALLKALWPTVVIEKMFEKDVAFIDENLMGQGYCCIVDGLFGTGLAKSLEGNIGKLVDKVNHSGIPVIAIDIPSGIDGQTGIAMGSYIVAKETVAFHRPKIGFYFHQGLEAVGEVIVCPIGIPPWFDETWGIDITNKEMVKKVITPRAKGSHKGDYGKILIIAGSFGMAGAAVFAAKGAVNAGAGLVTVACSKEVAFVVQQRVPEAMVLVLPDDEKEASEKVISYANNSDALVFGPGIGKQGQWKNVTEYLLTFHKPVVWDADGLYYLQKYQTIKLPLCHVITPHPGEGAGLLNKPLTWVLESPVKTVESLWKVTGGCVVLKGAATVAFNGESYSLNSTGSPGLAKGGSGDVLAGMLAAFLGKKKSSDGNDVFAATKAACYIHGLAGEKAASIIGENGMSPLDTIAQIPYIIKQLTGK